MWNRFRVNPVALAVIGLMGAGCVVVSADQNGNGWGREKASRDYRATLSLEGAERLSVKVP